MKKGSIWHRSGHTKAQTMFHASLLGQLRLPHWLLRLTWWHGWWWWAPEAWAKHAAVGGSQRTSFAETQISANWKQRSGSLKEPSKMPARDATACPPHPHYLLEVLVTYDILPLMGVLQLMSLDVLPQCLDDHWTCLGVDPQEASQTWVQFELWRLQRRKKKKPGARASKKQEYYFTIYFQKYPKIKNPESYLGMGKKSLGCF